MNIVRTEKAVAVLQIHDASTPALDYGFVEKLQNLIDELNHDKHLKVVIITGGDKYFSSGADASLLDTITQRGQKLYAFTRYVVAIPQLLVNIKTPTIAAMAGHAIGGGLALGLWCDFAFFAEQSLYGANFIKLGFTPGMGATAILPEILGEILAREMLYTGKLITGAEIKMANKNLARFILPYQDVVKQARELAAELAEINTDAIYLLKRAMQVNRMQLLQMCLEQELSMHETLGCIKD